MNGHSDGLGQRGPEPTQSNMPLPSGSLKRQLDGELMVSTSAVSNRPSTKKAKTEWEGEPSQALAKKGQEIENSTMAEDGNVFLQRMTDVIRLAAGNDGQESATSDISETLDMILAGRDQDTSDPGAIDPLGLGVGLVVGPASSHFLPAVQQSIAQFNAATIHIPPSSHLTELLPGDAVAYLLSSLAEFETTSSITQSPTVWLDASMVCVNSSIQNSLHLNETDKHECVRLVRGAKIYNVSWKTTMMPFIFTTPIPSVLSRTHSFI
ncbi:hypothetical protein PILCRDRAFT_345362 [Piloderma croceum F 1598]|uniref:Uncharacterized protein n=1 Tax=Piloderma croceum (strain F 1598) TaxID=765440 RepID=A0A0C3G582_PILCF|nr:hypothetical protein PILCRDRAFT_345362 [Piloderma croceum F 1598]